MRQTLCLAASILVLAGCNGASTRIDPSRVNADTRVQDERPTADVGSRIRIHIIPKGANDENGDCPVHDHAGSDGVRPDAQCTCESTPSQPL